MPVADLDGDTRQVLFGTDEPLPAVHVLRAGPLRARLSGARLLAVSVDGHEVWHGVAFLYRDPHWGTPEPVVEHCEQQAHEGGFTVRLRAYVPVEPRIELQIDIEGHADGRIRYQGTAISTGEIQTQRTGLCLLHPMDAAGRGIEVLHADGRASASTFPREIAPWPPFMGVRGIRHEFADEAWADSVFEGDVFELEDQRNNADASFKTYNRSNLMPRPYRLRAGQRVTQAVELRLLDAPAVPRVTAAAQPSPPATTTLGIGIEPGDGAAWPCLQAWVRELRPQHLLLRLDLAQVPPHWPGIRALVQASAAALRLGLECADEAAAPQAFNRLAGALREAGLEPESVAVFPSTPPVLAAARSAFPDCAVGGGTPHFFTQLNRVEDLGPVDHLGFATSAVVHGADDESVMAGLRSLPAMVRTLAARHPGVPVRIGPSGIGARRSPLGAQPHSDGTRRLALARHDPRSRALFGAAWLLGYVAQGLSAGADSLTLMTLAGVSGLLREQAGGARPCPAFFVLQALLAARGRGWRAVTPADGAWAGVEAVDGGTCLVANLQATEIELPASAVSLAGRRAEVLDAPAWQAWERQGSADTRSAPWRLLEDERGGPLRLPPYAVLLVHEEPRR